MLAKTRTADVSGIEGREVIVEIDIGRGLPGFYVVGLADSEIRESGQRVRSAIINSGFSYPYQKIVINLVPAYLRKKGSHYDLAIACGILAACGIIPQAAAWSGILIGELRLDGTVSPVRGLLPMIRALTEKRTDEEGEKEFFLLPMENYQEGMLAKEAYGINVIFVETLSEAVEFLQGKITEQKKERILQKEALRRSRKPEKDFYGDFADVKGQWAAKEAIAVAVCGNHSLLMIGPPGAGKTMLAQRVPTILPEMSSAEKLETTMIYSAAGFVNQDMPLTERRPFRQAGCRLTKAALLGGGNPPLPGEVSLAHNGVLFIDEFLELDRNIIEGLREPMEQKEVRIVRGGISYRFPASFLLIGAANPCPCGYFGDENHMCRCTPFQIERYRNKLSGPVMDRIDMAITVYPVDYKTLRTAAGGSSAQLRERVERGREMQAERFKNCEIDFNSQMEENHVRRFCSLGEKEKNFLDAVYQKYHLSNRRYYKILGVAQTIADMYPQNRGRISSYHLAAAFRYTFQDDFQERDNYGEI